VPGIEVSDYATSIVEILAANADPEANEVYAALDMPFATSRLRGTANDTADY
jgi:hypothetical protein